MSLIGPRPHAFSAKAAGRLYQEVVENYAERHKIKPGITGLAQVNGFRGETDTEEKIRRRIEYDLEYMENWSLMLDIKIILKTIYVIFRSDSAY
jgi:lipopolysaccharide/colanic/teichoic acid biosynthesis glycosyltransferase